MPRLAHRRTLSANLLAPLPPTRRRHRLTELLKLLVYVVILLTINSTLLARYQIEQTSMEPNFHPGQRVVVSLVGRTFGSWLHGSAYAAHPGSVVAGLERGQVVVFFETDDRSGSPLIKRLIGMPGDLVAIRDGAVYVNGSRLPEPYLSARTTCAAYCDLTLGDNEYFFMGDNRPVSRDSRMFGPIPGERIVGRVFIRFWPLDQLTLFL